MSNNSIDEIKKQIQEFVAKSKIGKAIALLIEYFDSINDNPRHNAALKLSAQFKSIERKTNLSEITQEEANVGMSKIIDSVLNIFEVIPIFEEDKSTIAEDNFSNRIIQIATLLIFLFLIIGIGLAIYTQGFDPLIKAIQASLFVMGVSMVAFGCLFFVKKYILA